MSDKITTVLMWLWLVSGFTYCALYMVFAAQVLPVMPTWQDVLFTLLTIPAGLSVPGFLIWSVRGQYIEDEFNYG